MVGAMIPSATSLLFENIEKAEGFFLSFASGILLYVTIGQLLPVINQGKVGRILFIGSILFTVIVFSLTGHHH